MAYRVSCYTHNPHLNIPRSFKIVIYLNLEHIYTSRINTFPFTPLFSRRPTIMSLCSIVCLIFKKHATISKPSIPCAILNTYIWSPRTRLVSEVVNLH